MILVFMAFVNAEHIRLIHSIGDHLTITTEQRERKEVSV